MSSLTVQGFRGIGASKTILFTPGPGLTLVVGRNGSGKSSFAEALEVLLTGDSRRWSERPKVWRDGWRSLHQPHPARVEAEFIVEGSTKVSATWDEGASLDGRTLTVQPRGKPKTTLQALGWTEELVSYRPFLSYNELGSTLDDGPSKLYDTLSSILGLEDLVVALNTLSKARIERSQALAQANQQREVLIEMLEDLIRQGPDDRASACLEALTSKDWGLAALERLPGEATVSDGGRDVDVLRRATAIELPSADQVKADAQALRAADAALKAIEGTDADRSRTLAMLLESAVAFHESHASRDCPVCGTGGAIGDTWVDVTRREIARLRGLARASEQAHQQAAIARKSALARLSPPPPVLGQLFEIGIDGLAVAREAWAKWHAGAALSDLVDLANHLEAEYETFFEAIENLKAAARTELARREDRWKPLAAAIVAWLPMAKSARRGAEDLPRIKTAENWLKRRLQIPATMLGVTRRPQSVVEVRTALDPVRAHIEDALALIHTTDLPRDVLQRLVPGFCRAALEASFIRIVRGRRLSAGRTHADVEEELQGAGKLSALAALVLFDDKDRAGDVGGRLRDKFDRDAEEEFHACRKGAHEPVDDDPHTLVRRTERLTERLLDLK